MALNFSSVTVKGYCLCFLLVLSDESHFSPLLALLISLEIIKVFIGFTSSCFVYLGLFLCVFLVFYFVFFNRSFTSEALPHCLSPSIIITEFLLRVHYLPHKSLHFHLTNLIAGSGFNPPYTEKPLQLFIWTRNLMECAWCSEQLPALKASPCWGQLGCLGLHIAGI